MKKQRLSKSDIKDLNERTSTFGIELGKKDAIDKVETAEAIYYLLNNSVLLVQKGDDFFPHLKALQSQEMLPTVTVDMGAIKFVVNGADIMRPGITHITEDLEQGSLVSIIDENNKRPIAVGRMKLSSEEMEKEKTGKVIQNLHYVGDELWKEQ